MRDLEQYWLSPEEDAISILSFVENVWYEEGRKKFAVLETKRGIEVAELGRFFEALQENPDRNYTALQEAMECMNAKQSRLFLATIDRKQKLINEVSYGIQRKFLKDVLALEEEKIKEVENEPHEASEDMRKLTVERRKAEAEELRVPDTSEAVLGERTMSGAQSSEGEAGLSSTKRCSESFGTRELPMVTKVLSAVLEVRRKRERQCCGKSRQTRRITSGMTCTLAWTTTRKS